MSTEQTRSRLLDAAETLFIEHGLEGTSLRAITSAANANLAAVNYHFQSKEGLIEAVFDRRIKPLNRERIRRLDEAARAAAPAPAELEQILGAFLAPALQLRASQDPGEANFLRLLGRVFSDPGDIKVVVLGQFRPTAQRFVAALTQALPDVPRPELLWRLHFLIGSLAHATAAGELIRLMSGGDCDPDDAEGILHHLTVYAAAGFRASHPQSAPQKVSLVNRQANP
jgi:AcrR family transcriptional regulator